MKVLQTISNWIAVLSVSLAATVLFPNVGRSEMVMYTITTNKTTYDPGELIQWQILLDIANSTASTNYGAATLSVDLVDSFGDTLIAGTINKSNSPSFAAYNLSDPGTWSSDFGKMYEVMVLKFDQSSDAVGIHDSQLNNILFASGSMVATSPGTHILSGTPGSSNTHFTASAQPFFLAKAYESITFTNATFTVTAVPEPSSIAMLCLGSGICLIRWRRLARRDVRHRRTAKRHQIADE